MARAPTVLFSSKPVWEEFTPSTSEICHPRVQAREGKAGDGARRLFRQGSERYACPSADWKDMEGGGGSEEGSEQTTSSGGGGSSQGGQASDGVTHPA